VRKMYKISVEGQFDAAHFLRGYQGSCENLHGHTYTVRAVAARNKLDRLGLVLDFKEMRRILHIAIDEMDHTLLNDLEVFKDRNPSAEHIAAHVYAVMQPLVELQGAELLEVTVWETPGNSITYSEERQE
jgi:6-pyruvoyltetrahydropterin/6-carboxytetrahydropterin synthase